MHNHAPISDFENKRVVVMGLGRFGGGVGVTRWLVQAGADVVLTDQADADTLERSLAQLADLNVTRRLKVVHGPHATALLDNADILVVNPAVPQPWDNPFIQEAKSRGLSVTTEIEIAYRQLNASKIVALTGSAGKSTTSAMVHHILNASGHHAILGGNIGGSLLDRLDEINDDTIIVLELSSAMIYWLWGTSTINNPPYAPAVACITNYTPNHINWHGSESHYQESKKQLISILPSISNAILPQSLENWVSFTKGTIQLIHDEDLITGCAVPGAHNSINAAMAVQASIAITESDQRKTFVQSVKSFAGLPHRLNLCHSASGITFFNDSKSTVPEATILAVEAVAQHTLRNKIHLIAGGSDKGSDLSAIANLHDQLAGLYTIGATGESISHGDNAQYCGTLDTAIERAFNNSNSGDTILLSPGCASLDQFTNYEQRGDRFVSLIKQLTQSPSCSPNS